MIGRRDLLAEEAELELTIALHVDSAREGSGAPNNATTPRGRTPREL